MIYVGQVLDALLTMQAVRVEEDLLGKAEVPLTALYGAQTQRAILNFPLLRSRTIGDYREGVDVLRIVKMPAANTSLRAGYLDSRKVSAIVEASEKILAGGY